MGITGLLPFLKKASREANIKDFKGCTVAIDSYCWLHKGAFSCADKLALGEKTDQYVYYCMKYVNSLLSYGLKPIMVFDGARLPSKEGVEKERKERRETYRKKAAQLLREGRRAEARECLQRCVDITPTMALELMNACRAKGVDCIVAPYEADAQLAYLNRVGIAQIIISEDSDLLLFGCKKVMYKMDFAGNGVLIEQEDLPKAMDLKADVYTFDKFRYMCILSGCDYLPSLPGIGLGKANKLFKLTRQTDMTTVLKKLPTTLKMSSLEVSGDYLQGFTRANNTFLYQLCFDPFRRKQVPLLPYQDDVDPRDLEYAGPYMSKERALQMALGNLDHYTGKAIADFDPDTSPLIKKGLDTPSHMLSIWDPYYRPMKLSMGGNKDTPQGVERASTKGKEVVVQSVTRRAIPPQPLPKRQREPEDGATIGDLCGVYGAEGPKPTKRPRCDWDDTEGTPEESLQPASTQPPNSTSLSSPPRQSLREIQPNCEPTSPPLSPQKAEPPPEASPTKEPSPRVSKNRFAAHGAGKKTRFDLNAGKAQDAIVRSRFFTSNAKPLPKTTFFHSLGESFSSEEKNVERETELREATPASEDGLTASSPEQQGEEGEIIADAECAATPKSRFSVGKTVAKQQCVSKNPVAQRSPYGSFGFGGKLQMFKSTFDKAGASLPSSLQSQKPFKPVVTGRDNKENDHGVCPGRSPGGGAGGAGHQSPGGPCKDIPMKTSEASSPVSSRTTSQRDSDDSEEVVFTGTSASTSITEPKLPTLLKLDSLPKPPTPIGGCRGVGLSKSAKGGKTPKDKQANITSFFSRFANKKKTS